MILLVIALAPCLFLIWYFYHRDRYEPEPKKEIIMIALWGGVMIIPAAIIELSFIAVFKMFTAGVLYTFIISFLVIAPTEELSKFLVVRIRAYRNIEFDEIMDGIVYTVSASLGFAAVENVAYVLSNGIGVGIARALLAVPGHAFFGALMGYYLGRAKLEVAREKSLIWRGLIYAVLCHGLYDFLILTSTGLALLTIPLIIILGFLVRKNLKKAELQSRARLKP